MAPISVSKPSSSAAPAVEDAEADLPPARIYTVALRILLGSNILSSIVSLASSNRASILNKARTVYAERIPEAGKIKAGWVAGCDPKLVSLQMYGLELDLSTYDVEDMTYLIETAEKTHIPMFTVRMS